MLWRPMKNETYFSCLWNDKMVLQKEINDLVMKILEINPFMFRISLEYFAWHHDTINQN